MINDIIDSICATEMSVKRLLSLESGNEKYIDKFSLISGVKESCIKNKIKALSMITGRVGE